MFPAENLDISKRRYFDLADKQEILIQRGKNKAYRLLPVTENDYTDPIPLEYLCNPFDISPSGDRFWADKRNVEKLNETIEIFEKHIKEGKRTMDQ